MLTLTAGLLALSFTVTPLGDDQGPSRHGGMDGARVYTAAATTWKPGPASLPPGAQIAVLEGDPSKEGPFVFRLKLPDGYRVPPHTHAKTERVTVLSGTFHLGMGATFDRDAARPLPAGSYGYWPAGMKHFVWAEGDTVLQFHGSGPWSIQYLNPQDDPRQHKSSSR